MKVKFTTIAVKDLKESVAFYQEILGFVKVRSFSPAEGVDIVFMKDEDSGLIELIGHEAKTGSEEDSRASMVSIGLGVTDLEKTLDELKHKGVEPVRGPVVTPGGEKFVFIKDPNGVEIELIQGFGD